MEHTVRSVELELIRPRSLCLHYVGEFHDLNEHSVSLVLLGYTAPIPTCQSVWFQFVYHNGAERIRTAICSLRTNYSPIEIRPLSPCNPLAP